MIKTKNRLIVYGLIILSLLSSCKEIDKKQEKEKETIVKSERWSEKMANDWAADKPWLRGANFNPSTAINQLEVWQAESFDP